MLAVCSQENEQAHKVYSKVRTVGQRHNEENGVNDHGKLKLRQGTAQHVCYICLEEQPYCEHC